MITIAGPALGSALYSVGGFSLPFYVLGSTILVLTVISLYLLRKVRTDENCNSLESTREAVNTERTIANNEIKFGDVFKVKLNFAYVYVSLHTIGHFFHISYMTVIFVTCSPSLSWTPLWTTSWQAAECLLSNLCCQPTSETISSIRIPSMQQMLR